MKAIFVFVILTLIPGLDGFAAAEQDPPRTCQTLLADGERLTGSLHRDVRALGTAKLRDAMEVCVLPTVEPELRARALLLGVRLHGGERKVRLEMRRQALDLLRSKAPDSPLIPQALEAVADSLLVAGDYDGGVELSLEALDARQRLFGTESREYVRGLIWTSVAYKSAAHATEGTGTDLELAHAYSERAVEHARGLFGPHDPTTIAASMDLADTLNRLGRYDEANALQEAISPYVDIADELPERLAPAPKTSS